MKIEVYPRRTLLGRKVWDFRLISSHKMPGPGRRILASSHQGYNHAVDAEGAARTIKDEAGAAAIDRVAR